MRGKAIGAEWVVVVEDREDELAFRRNEPETRVRRPALQGLGMRFMQPVVLGNRGDVEVVQGGVAGHVVSFSWVGSSSSFAVMR